MQAGAVSRRALAAACIVALFALALFWQLWWFVPARVPAWLAAAIHAAPMLPALVLLLLRRRSAAFWGGLGALFTFSHGVSEAWADAEVRAAALTEVALSVALVVAASWGGLRQRFARRRGV
ncbi:MAG: DUF2069 domain-containing protein [Chiayiivirga sp.]|jgi:uncharacterized membrane protein|uniref:DUF2069 domain-containing protein n=1 Tax=Denitratimonas tolerans TaxID=1338420 RepID=A0AAW9R2F0_9GAMM|nr:DUF2069 domain-containing protein [Xanthomonadaceae bacterium]MDX9763806.1 DUF2069 domain-containing protein [Chiayiivirga sp.]HMN35620.1 DUF2069 domain-containing protein [Chiayiivirga sp.]HRQ34272.1 DUF2069 domain-containing protein [Chiayiivirga sp.]